MTLIALDQIEPGMITKNDIVNNRGQILLPKNIELNPKHIHGLRSWAIRYVDVFLNNNSNITELSQEDKEILNQRLDWNFTLNAAQSDHPIVVKCKDIHLNFLENSFVSGSNNDKGTPLTFPEPAEKWFTIKHLIQSTQNLSTIPELHRNLVLKMNQPNVPLAELGNIIATDPSLSMRLLKMANSAYYGSNYRLDTVAKAVSVVGFDDLQVLIEETPQMQNFSGSAPINADMYHLWKHSVATSIFTSIICDVIKYPNPEKLIMLGLIHDVGKLVLYSHIPAQYSHICDYSYQNRLSPLKVERKTLGFYHNLVTMELLKHWNFSKICQEIIYYHHTPENAFHKKEAYITHLADLFAHVIGLSGNQRSLIPAVDVAVWDILRLKNKFIDAIFAQGRQSIEDIIRSHLAADTHLN